MQEENSQPGKYDRTHTERSDDEWRQLQLKSLGGE